LTQPRLSAFGEEQQESHALDPILGQLRYG